MSCHPGGQHPLIPNHPIHPPIFSLSRCIVASKTYHLCLVAEAFSTLTLQESFLMAGTNERRDFPAINDSETCKIPVQRPLWTFENYIVITGFCMAFCITTQSHLDQILTNNKGDMCEEVALWCSDAGYSVIHGSSGMYSRLGWRQCSQFTLT